MSDLPMTREQIAEELLKCDPGVQWYPKSGHGRLVILAEHILRICTIALREENKRLNAFLAESCQEMRSHGPYDGSGPCPEIMRLVEENKRLRGDHIECNQGRDIISSLSDAMNTLPACGMLAIVGAAMQEIDALRSGEFICKKCGLRKDADNFFNSVPF